MIKLLSILQEAKQVGILYHYTSITKLINIIKINTLKTNTGYEEGNYISFTRNKNPDFGIAATSLTRLELDGDKLSNNYKITPYHDLYDPEVDDEMEERIYKDIINLNKYIIKVTLYESRSSKWQFEKLIELLEEKNIIFEIK